MKDLHQYGYLRYDPSYHPLRGSWVYLFEFDKAVDGNMSSICRSGKHLLDKLDITAEHDKDMLSRLKPSASKEPPESLKHIQT